MDNLVACRICFSTDAKLYDMCKYSLEKDYENLTGIDMTGTWFQHICTYCGALLKKYMMFRQRCVQSHNVLELLLAENVTITTDHIRNINGKLPNLKNPYTTQPIDCYDSTIQIKEEIYEGNIHPDLNTNEYLNYTEDFNNDYSKAKNNKAINYDIETTSDSDEEPLSKKVNKKKVKCENKSIYQFEQTDAERNDYDYDSISNDLIKNDYDKNDFNTNNLEEHDHTVDSDSDYFANNDRNDSDTDDLQNVCDRNPNLKSFKNRKSSKQDKFIFHRDEIEHKLVMLSKEEQIKEVIERKESLKYKNSLFKCEDCYKGFMMEVPYKNHLIRHDPVSGPITCDICCMRWPDGRALRAHMLMSHERKYICKICGHTSKTAHKAKEHIAWHKGAVFTCKLCGSTFTKNTSYLTHMRLRHPTENVCELCGMSFLGEKGLDMHRKKAHLVEGDESAECELCRIRFDTRDALVRHTELGCDDNLSWCSKCGEHFSTAEQMKNHLNSHGKQILGCDECPRTFAHARLLAAHVLRMHREQPPRTGGVCELCGVHCVSRSSLVNHQRTHSGEKPFACGVCNKRFRVLQLLQIHTRTHTGERPFPCSRCPKAFKHKAALNRHIRVHTGAKPYVCPQCGKSFSQSNSMKQHCAGVHMKMYLYSRRAANKHTV